MKIKSALTILISFIVISFTAQITYGVEISSENGNGTMTVTANVDQDLFSKLVLLPETIEIGQPSTVQVTMLSTANKAIPSRAISLYVNNSPTEISITQPTTATNSLGITTGTISSKTAGTYTVCAKDITGGGSVSISDCKTLTVIPTVTPTLVEEPQYTKTTTNSLAWSTKGTQTYKYYIEASTTSDFSNIVANSDWIDTLAYTFTNLDKKTMYFYRVKAKNQYDSESNWSNITFSSQYDNPTSISLMEISNIGSNTRTNWDPNYDLSIKYKLTDEIGISSKKFWCQDAKGNKLKCTYTENLSGNVLEYSMKLSGLAKLSSNTLYDQYAFCVEIKDNTGEVITDCSAKLAITGDAEGTKVSVITETIEKVVSKVVDSTLGQMSQENVQNVTTVTAAVNVATFLGILFNGIGTFPYFVLEISFALSSILGFKKKGNVTGFVYDSTTKNPIRQAIVRIYNQSHELSWTDVTDGNGNFRAPDVENGPYYIKVTARGYKFPSKIVFGNTDYPLTDIYYGAYFAVNDKKIPNFSIPLDKIEIKQSEILFQKFISRIKWLLTPLQVIIFVAGLIYAIYAVYTTPIWWNYLIITLYIPATIAMLFSWLGKREKYGHVKDEAKHLVKGLVIGLYDKEFGTLVAKRVSDELGKYRFIVGKGNYYISLLTPGYYIKSSNNVSDIIVKGKEAEAICPNIEIEKTPQ